MRKALAATAAALALSGGAYAATQSSQYTPKLVTYTAEDDAAVTTTGPTFSGADPSVTFDVTAETRAIYVIWQSTTSTGGSDVGISIDGADPAARGVYTTSDGPGTYWDFENLTTGWGLTPGKHTIALAYAGGTAHEPSRV